MGVVHSRRGFLFSVSGAVTAANAKAADIASEQRRFLDPLTEFNLLRLTDPAVSSCVLPPSPLRATGSGNSLLYSSDRSGAMQAYRMDLKSGESRLLTQAAELDPRSATLLADDRSICYCDGPSLCVAASRTRTIYTTTADWKRDPKAFGVADDGGYAFLAEQSGSRWRMQAIPLRGTASRSASTVIIESNTPFLSVTARPKRSGLVYRQADGLFLVNYDGEQNRRLKLADGIVLSELWAADGRSLFYLLQAGGKYELREHIPDANRDTLIAKTTQFVSFARNSKSTVFAGIGGSLGAPYVLILVRSVRREMAVAEHKTSDPASTAIQFSPNGQQLFYQSDRQGKPAIYMVSLERFLESTDGEPSSDL